MPSLTRQVGRAASAELALSWRAVDERAHAALEDYDRAMRLEHLTWEATTASDSRPVTHVSRPLD